MFNELVISSLFRQGFTNFKLGGGAEAMPSLKKTLLKCLKMA